MNLTATRVPSDACTPSHTEPMPPRPIMRVSWYLPATSSVLGVSGVLDMPRQGTRLGPIPLDDHADHAPSARLAPRPVRHRSVGLPVPRVPRHAAALEPAHRRADARDVRYGV